MRSIRHLLLPVLLLLAIPVHGIAAAVTFSVTPTTVSNTYSGQIALQISGLTNSETVVLQKFLDVNANGLIDGPDLLVQQFVLTDGQPGMVIGGVTNSNVPGDLDGPNGAITAALTFQIPGQNFTGNYLYRLSSPSSHFAPLTNQFAVTNFPFAQQIAGSASNGTLTPAVPNAIVLLFQGPRPGHSGPGKLLAGAVADTSGHYALPMPPGTYLAMAFSSNYVFNFPAAPLLTLGAGQTLITNLALTNSSSAVSGTIADAGEPSLGLPGVLLPAVSTGGWVAFAYSDTNGNFSLPVLPGSWRFGSTDWAIAPGYVGWYEGTNVVAPAAGLTLAYPRATALFYGTVKDTLGHPLAGIGVGSSDSGQEYDSETYTDTNGNYFLGVLGGLSWNLDVSTGTSPTSYVYSYPDFNSTGLNSGQVLEVNFTALPATNHISGSLKDNLGNPVPNIGIWANATINGINFHVNSVNTDSNGNYSLTVGNGTWDVGGFLNFPSNYLVAGDQTVAISNRDAIVNFVATLTTQHISGSVTDASGNPAVGATVTAINGQGSNAPEATADGAGNYILNVVNGTWTVGIFDDATVSGSYLGLGTQTVVVSNNNPVVNLTAVLATNKITGSVKDINGGPLSGVAVFGDPGFGFVASVPGTDANGNYVLYVANGTWKISLGLLPATYLNPPDQTAVISNNDAVVNFILMPHPMLSSPRRLATGRFQFLLTGVAGQNYTVQFSTNLTSTNWTTLFITNNPATNDFIVTDASATNRQRFYRALTGP